MAYIFLAPILLYFAIFYFFPIGLEFWASLRTGQPLIGTSSFVGLENYIRALDDPRVLNSFWVTMVFAVGYTVFSIVVGLGLALLLNQGLPGTIPLRAIIFFPYMTTFVIIALMWTNMLDPTIGILNSGLVSLGLPTQRWLVTPEGAMPTIIAITVWHTAGYNMVLFLGGLQGIPSVYYDAAKIDGANVWDRVRYITLPLLAPTTLFVSIVSMINGLQAFMQAYIMTKGGPADTTRLLAYHIFRVAFTENDFGYASALAFMMLVVILMLTLFQFRVGGQEVEY